MKRITAIVIGALLIACGVLYSLDVLGLADFAISLDGWWALFIIVPCFGGLISGQDTLGNLAGLCVGVMLLLAARGVFSYSIVWKLLVPLLVVILGIKMILRALGTPQRKRPAVGTERELSAIFCEDNGDFSGETVSVASVRAIFGGSGCNLVNANIVDGCRIDVLCAFGGVEIRLPERVVVKNEAFCFFGGMEDKRAVAPDPTGCVTVYIRGTCLFGGVEIK